MQKSRDLKIDTLKALGILCVILAHCHPPKWLMQLRNFDVPLMVLVSGYLFYTSFSKKQLSYWQYFQKRVIRLVNPVWLFLLVFFSTAYGIYSLVAENYPFSVSDIVESFLLYEGIGYVWVIRVFLLVALISPPLFFFYQRVKSRTFFLSVVAAIYTTYEIALPFVTSTGNKMAAFLTDEIVGYTIAYGAVAALGMVLPGMRSQSVLLLSLFFLAVFTSFELFSLWTSHNLLFTQNFKYPPTLPYLSYAMGVSLLLYWRLDKNARFPQLPEVFR
jgi:fucose 4-O-acetylase-like acetyltransferase